MSKYIKSLKLDGFRGIHDLDIEELNHINIFSGDNNSGKTSILEALLLLRNTNEFSNILRIANSRESLNRFSGITSFENFLNLFSHDDKQLKILIQTVIDENYICFELGGELKNVMLDLDEINSGIPKHLRYSANDNSRYVETEMFSGILISKNEANVVKRDIKYTPYDRISGTEIRNNNLLKMFYISPTDHVRGNIISNILRNEYYKELCIQIVKLFDPLIEDLLVLKNTTNNRSAEYIKHVNYGLMPLSTVGDGLKKVLSLANGIIKAENGILLIDEIETAIHPSYFEEIFRFLIKACLTFNIQLFITTHSLEAIDGLLNTQKEVNEDIFSVITFKKDTKKTHVRVLSGKQTIKNREEFDFEVRE